MSHAAIQMARTISAMIPLKPALTLRGLTECQKEERHAHFAAKAAAVAAWQYAAAIALNEASSAAPGDWFIDQDNHEFIKGCESIADLEAMCDPAYPWSGRRADQI